MLVSGRGYEVGERERERERGGEEREKEVEREFVKEGEVV